MRTLVITILALLGLMIGASPATAQIVWPRTNTPVVSTLVQDSLAIAEAYWQEPVATGTPTVYGVGQADLTPFQAAGAETPIGLAEPSTSNIWLDLTFFRPRDYETWIFECTVIVHEYGHLIFRVHSLDPQSVMFAASLDPVRRCYTRFKPKSVSRAADRRRYGERTWALPWAEKVAPYTYS